MSDDLSLSDEYDSDDYMSSEEQAQFYTELVQIFKKYDKTFKSLPPLKSPLTPAVKESMQSAFPALKNLADSLRNGIASIDAQRLLGEPVLNFDAPILEPTIDVSTITGNSSEISKALSTLDNKSMEIFPDNEGSFTLKVDSSAYSYLRDIGFEGYINVLLESSDD